MRGYPKKVRGAAIKCIPCNAPVIETVDGEYVCVECGATPVRPLRGDERTVRIQSTKTGAD